MSATRDGSFVPKEAIRLYLSGGGNRAALGSVGAVCALYDADEWQHVSEVVSVSGGSMANGALAAATDHDDPRPSLGDMAHRLLDDGMKVGATPRRRLLVVGAAASLLAVVAVLLAAAGVGPWSPPAWVGVVMGLLFVPAVVFIIRRLGPILYRDVVDAIVGPDAETELSHLPAQAGDRRHVFCAAGLSSGVPYAFWTGGTAPAVRWGEAIQVDYTVADAVNASSSLPALGSVNAPGALRSERLVDGGAVGIFGQQAHEGFARTARNTYRGTERIVAVDGGRHSVSAGSTGRMVGFFSSTYLLMRWLKVSLEATYVNDLVDARGQTLVRLCRDPSMPATGGPLGPVLDSLAASTTSLGLTSLGTDAAIDAVACGYARMRVQLEPAFTDREMADALALAGDQLGFGERLAERWQAHGGSSPSSANGQ